MKEIYLDNAATTKIFDDVVEKMYNFQKSYYGNPSSLHKIGINVENIVENSLEKISKLLSNKINKNNIIVTSGGTESNNMAIFGSLNRNKCEKRIITTKIEHPSVLKPIKELKKYGYIIDYLDVDKNGLVDIEQLKSLLNKNTVFVSIIYVNNEIGVIQDIKKLVNIVKNYNENIIFHTDAVQAVGKIKIDPYILGVDLLSASAHKFHGPYGIGFLYVKNIKKIKPIIFGGGQQNGLRSGTENIYNIFGMSCALEKSLKNLEEINLNIFKLKKFFIEGLNRLNSNILINCKDYQNCINIIHPSILSVSFVNKKGEILLHLLEKEGIYVSVGSACSSNSNKKSYVLKSIGLTDKEIEGTLRFSFSQFTNIEDIKYVLKILKKILI